MLNKNSHVNINSAQLRAGVHLLADEWGVVSRFAAEPMVIELFTAMQKANFSSIERNKNFLEALKRRID